MRTSVTKAIRRACRTCLGQGWAYFAFLLVQLALRAMAMTPLLFLCDSRLRGWALLCVPFFLLIVPPARANAAEVMQRALSGGSLQDQGLVLCPDWGRKVLRGLGQGLLLIAWAAPFLAVTAWAVQMYGGQTRVGETDAFSLVARLSDLGGGDMQNGVIFALLIYLACLLPFLVGLAFHSGRRHERALSEKRFLRGRRGGVLRAWLAGLVTELPFAAAAVWVSMDYVRALIRSLRDLSGGFSLPPLDQRIWLIAGAFVLLWLPLQPLRSMITAAFVRGVWEEKQ